LWGEEVDVLEEVSGVDGRMVGKRWVEGETLKNIGIEGKSLEIRMKHWSLARKHWNLA
jgi:hypothetical protein